MEMLVVVAIFSIGSVVIAATYVNFTRLHRRVANAELLGQDLRFVMELLVRTARNNTVTYPPLPATLVSPSSTLALTSSGGTPIFIRRFATSSSVCAGLNAACLALSTDAGLNWGAITGKQIAINRFEVYVTPTANPFETTGIGTYQNDQQPRVTFLIDAAYVTSSTLEKATLRLQTSVSSRVYLR
ncbi:MAG: hypothetical protein RL141_309 [Candidatus Parcubacteria bacterium]